MARTFRDQIDEVILDRAAALLASHGFAKTSIQDVADAVGLSKAGLLHHFPSKDALNEAALAYAETCGLKVVQQVSHLPVGVERDVLAMELLLDFALSHPGVVALMVLPTVRADTDTVQRSHRDPASPLQAFGVDPAKPDSARFIRVAGALAALAVLSLAANEANQVTQWRPHIVATCIDALGHRRPSAPHSTSDQFEA